MKKVVLLSLLLFLFFCDAMSQTTTPRRDAGRYGIRPILIRGPYLQVATPTSMIVRWRTDMLDVSFVRYGTEPGKLDKLAGHDFRTNEHIVTINGLTPDTKYYYMIEGFKDTLQGDANNYFTTLPLQGKEAKYRIGVYGDCGSISARQGNARDQFEKYLGNNVLNAWILLGDNAYSFGKDVEYQSHFFNIYKDNLLKKSPLFPSPGNHDYQDEPYAAEVAQRSGEVAYYQNFSMPTKGESGGLASHTSAFYSFDIGNVHFISLDSHGSQENGKRLFDTTSTEVQWVKRDLEANKNKGWVVAYWHHPPYSMGSHNSDTETQMVKIRENFVPILERYGVDLILCGHSHSYERSKLMQGHYGMEASFSETKHLLSTSSGFYDGSANSCPYIKDATGKGTVYVVSGSSSRTDHKQATFPHDALPFSNVDYAGACILEVEGNRLDLKWICEDGQIRDRFTMMKNVQQKTIVKAKKGQTVTLTASYVGEYSWKGSTKKTRSIEVKPSAGVSTYIVNDPQNCIQQEFEVQVSGN
ncbi:MAG: metallophosphoesterase family protein [Chitinophagaceae bacterium]|nr:metallophosphoesterase family protein [Chitinophagaceae bacterium]